MHATGLATDRQRTLAPGTPRAGRYVLYWMERSQRAEDNHALEVAVAHANALGCPVVVAVGCDPGDRELGERAYRFMLEGLRETEAALTARGVRFVARLGSPPDVALALAADARVLICDRGHLRHQRAWRARVATEAGCPVLEVETDAVVPVEAASDRAEVAARTFRPRVRRELDRWLELPLAVPVREGGAALEDLPSLALDDPAALARELSAGRGPSAASAWHPGGAREAMARLQRFLADGLPRYAQERSRVPGHAGSELSMYLRHGHLSPLRVAFEVRRAGARDAAGRAGAEAFLEQLVVRRELAINYVSFTDGYDRFEALPAWARATLDDHRSDPREGDMTEERLVAAETHDAAFNAAMLELRETGSMHPYMRMYWGKRLLAWSRTPEEGFERTLRLNNRYFLDGRDPNSYANVAWCYGLHDRPFPERPVFGKVRSMTAGGLARKHDPEGYVADVGRRLDRSV